MKRWADVIIHRQEEDLSDFKAATFGQRVAAFLIDIVFLSTFLILIQTSARGLLLFYYGHGAESERLIEDPVNMFTFLMALAYFVIPIYISGQTLGKKIMRLRVVNEDFSARLSLGKVIVREFLMLLFSLPPFSIVFLMLMITPEKRAWHDQMTRTRVILYK